MVSGFINVRFRASEKEEDELRSVGTRSMAVRGTGRPRSMDDAEKNFTNDESAARFYMRRVFEGDHRNTVRGLSPSDRSEAVPDMLFVGVQESPLTRTKLARFKQTHSTIPVFGSQALVELDRDRELVSIDAELAGIQGVPSVASISAAQALKTIETFTGATSESLQEVAAPELTYYHDDVNNSWHLAFLFKHVPAVPADYEQTSSTNLGHRLGKSPRQMRPEFNYLVDAHTSQILFYYSSNPLIGIPSRCYGIDEDGTTQEFFGNKTEGGFEMFDPLRAIRTYDLEGKDLEITASPARPVHSIQSNWNDANKAAVTAHVNAMKVYRFYKEVLVRDGIDDKGMDLISVVNCIYEKDQPGPEWFNAVWWKNKMWYGQSKERDGKLRSFSRFLDVIAHELTHGVTQFTSDLIYEGESGALNESFSDIFGVIIKNWYALGPKSDVGQWNWELGTGLAGGGLPLRDLSDPRRTNDPDHMRDYLVTHKDSGGVHTNSSIHNKAAYNVLVARDAQGNYIFSPEDVAILYYLCLIRLPPRAGFKDALQGLIDVALTFFAGDPNSQQKIQCIKDAYAEVGIK